MKRMRRAGRGTAALLAGLLLAVAGCGPHGPRAAPRVLVWNAGREEPAFDPDGPPDPLRWAIERQLSRGLVERDSGGRVVPALAETLWASRDSLTWTFRLRPGLQFTDGTPLTSAHLRSALAGGLGRDDQATRAWLLMALRGVDRVRPGRPLPPLGIAAPDARTLVLQLARRDPRLLERLALPGVATPWRRRGGDWRDAVGVGPYRVVAQLADRELVLARGDSTSGRAAVYDTLRIRFASGAPRMRALLRRQAPDLVWPLPPELLSEPLPPGYALGQRPATPPRRLLLVLRPDVPPLTQLAARHVLAHGLNHEELLAALGPRGRPLTGWLEGGGPFDFPSLDLAQARDWMDRGHLGRSFSIALAYDADLAGAAVARTLQGEWARLGVYAELRPLRGADAQAEALRAAAAQAQLVESQAPIAGAAAELATLVLPLRGPAIGAFRTGWRTREFDPWVALPAPPGPPLDAAGAQRRLAEDRVVLPLADLPWTWLAGPGGGGVGWDARFGPDATRAAFPRRRRR